VAWNYTELILPLSNLGYRKNSMKVKIAMFVPASVYDRVTLTAARSSLIKGLHSDDPRGDRRQARSGANSIKHGRTSNDGKHAPAAALNQSREQGGNDDHHIDDSERGNEQFRAEISHTSIN